MRKRKWIYVQQPWEYEISCDLCGGTNIAWSEYEHMIWCFDCEKDTAGDGGVFDGPIALGLCGMLGLNFDRVDLKTGKRLYLTQYNRKGRLTWRRKKPEPKDDPQHMA